MTPTPEISTLAAQLLVDQLLRAAAPLFASGAPVIAIAGCCGQLSVGLPDRISGQAPPCPVCLRPFSCSQVLSSAALAPEMSGLLRAGLVSVLRTADE